MEGSKERRNQEENVSLKQ